MCTPPCQVASICGFRCVPPAEIVCREVSGESAASLIVVTLLMGLLQCSEDCGRAALFAGDMVVTAAG